MDQGFAKVDQEFAKVDQQVSQRSTKSEFTKINQEFAKVDRGFTEIRGRFDATAAGQQQIVDLLQSLTGNPGSETDG